MKTKQAASGRHRGSTLVFVTAMGAVVAILAMAMIQLGLHARLGAVRDVRRIAARCAADAGLAEAVLRMQNKIIAEVVWTDIGLPANSVTLANGAQFDYTITIVQARQKYDVTSVGTCGQVGTARRTHCAMKTGSYWEGIGVKETVDIKLGTSFGVVGPGVPADMTIRSNSTETDAMKFKAFVTVPGDIVCGPGGDPNTVIDTKATTVVLGEMYAAKEELIFPDVIAPPPPYTYSLGNYSTSNLLITGSNISYYFDSLTILNSGKLQITGKNVTIYVSGKMTLNQSAEVEVTGGGSVKFYLGTCLEDKNSTGFSNLNSDDASALKIYGLPTCTWIDLKAKSSLAAAVYAPDADIDLYNNGDFIGAITGNSFEMKNSGNFYFDTRLMDVDIDDPAATFVVGRWWED